MAKNKIVRRIRGEKKSPQEVRRLNDIRAKAKQDFPPLDPPRLQPAADGIGAEIRAAREAQGLTWYSLAKKASVPNPTTIRDIEYGRDAKLSKLARSCRLNFTPSSKSSNDTLWTIENRRILRLKFMGVPVTPFNAIWLSWVDLFKELGPQMTGGTSR